MAQSEISSNISAFVNDIQSTRLAYANRYEVVIIRPYLGAGGENINQRTNFIDHERSVSMRCNSITLPGRGFSTVPYRFYGPARNMPYEQIYSGEMSLSVILSEDLRERDFFDVWMGFISSTYSRQNYAFREPDYKFAFYDDYTTTVTINVLNKAPDDHNKPYSVDVLEAYPKSIGDIQLGYDKDNEFLVQDVVLAFRKYQYRSYGIQSPPEPKREPQSTYLNALLSDEFAPPPTPPTLQVGNKTVYTFR